MRYRTTQRIEDVTFREIRLIFGVLMSMEADTITDDRIAGIADRMTEEGRKVSPVTVWSEVQSGSIVEIAGALQRWREARQPATSPGQDQFGLPENLAEPMMSAAARLWAAARDEAERAVGERLGVVNSHLDTALAERDDALTAYQRAAEDIGTQRERILAVTNALSAAETAVAHVTEKLASASSRAEVAETRLDELVQRTSEADAKLERTQTALEEERSARGELAAVVTAKTAEIERTHLERDEARQEILTLVGVCQQQTSALSASENEVARLVAELAAATGRAETAESRVDELVQRAANAEAGLDAAQTTLGEERKTREELAAVVASKSEEMTQLVQQRDEARQEAATWNEACREKTHALSVAENEAARLAMELATATGLAETAGTRLQELKQLTSKAAAQLALSRTTLDEERKAREELATLVASQSDEVARLAAELATATGRADAAETRMAELSQRASEEGARLEQTQASLDEERRAREALDVAVASKSDEIGRIAEERDAVRRELATLSETHQAQSNDVSRLSNEASSASSRAEAATTQANQSLARAVALETQLDEARGALAAEREITSTTVDQASVQRNELQRAARELVEARERVNALSHAKTDADAEFARLTQQASAAQERAEAAEERAAELAQRIAKLNEARTADAQSDQEPEIQANGSDQADDVDVLQRQISAQAKVHAKAFGELRASAEQWVAHAKELKQRLGLASEKVLYIDARSTGEVALVRRLSSELERLKPDHELVSRDAQQKLISMTMAQQLAAKGYKYDPSTAVMSKVEG
jgi:chromosome segregation ATPase